MLEEPVLEVPVLEEAEPDDAVVEEPDPLVVVADDDEWLVVEPVEALIPPAPPVIPYSS